MKDKTLHDILSEIQVKFKAKKSRYNSFGKYNYRSTEDILEAIKPYLETYDLTLIIEEEFITGDMPVIKSIAKLSRMSEEKTAIAFAGVDLNQKGMSTPQQFGSASSYAKKYALGNLLLIDDSSDPDDEVHHPKNNTSKTTEKNPQKVTNKPALSDDRFAKALNSIQTGEVSKDVVINSFKLTDEQRKKIDSL